MDKPAEFTTGLTAYGKLLEKPMENYLHCSVLLEGIHSQTLAQGRYDFHIENLSICFWKEDRREDET